ncbi:hypothetical protein KIW84_055455 [Lathyrus oleraceus]|uniref:Uncharacterized protein n=1 Tax=Pisum sativum TaxID=3888 RepID=A0A9D5AJY8_PEA|nr:hypothetical protein KIW84_055455 [Pisum sativum]
MGERRPEAEDQSIGIAINSSRNTHSNESLNGSWNKTQEKSNKRPSLDCCSFKPLKQREIPCSSLEQRPMEKVKDPAAKPLTEPTYGIVYAQHAIRLTTGYGACYVPASALSADSIAGICVHWNAYTGKELDYMMVGHSPIHVGLSTLLLGGIFCYIRTGKDIGWSCAFPTLARVRCETRFFNHYFSSTLNSVLLGSRSGGSLFVVAGATGGFGSRLRTSEPFDPKHQNIDH